ncbi:Fbox/WD repeatcontaining protein sel10like, partial [Caligus rogercresseyi]
MGGHGGPVLCVYWAGFTLFLGSADKTIKQWSVETGECLCTLSGHGDAVTCNSLETDRIVTGSLDRLD